MTNPLIEAMRKGRQVADIALPAIRLFMVTTFEGERCACPLGLAYIGTYPYWNWIGNWGQHLVSSSKVVNDRLFSLFAGDLNWTARCPIPYCSSHEDIITIHAMAMHLNDEHRLTLDESIAALENLLPKGY